MARVRPIDNGNAMLQSFLSKLFKKEIGILSYRRYGESGKNMCFEKIICWRDCTRRNLYFRVENCQHADQ